MVLFKRTGLDVTPRLPKLEQSQPAELLPNVGWRPEPRGRVWLARAREFWFGQTDLAPLSLLRIVYGLLLIVWLAQLWPDLAAFFSDEGMMPRSQLVSSYPGLPSLLMLVGQWWQVAAFWCAAVVVAVMLTVGYRTRLACLLAFVAVLSFANRNPLMLDSSDFVFKLVPFWMMFTAAAERYSIDALLRKARGETSSGRGPAFPVRLLEFQIGWIYLATALEKWPGKTWLDGTAVYYVFQLSHTFARPFAAPLASNLDLVRAFTWETLAVEVASLPLMFLPGPCRLLGMAAVVLLQLGILTMLNVGNFPLIMLAVMVLFLPPAWIERLTARVRDSRLWGAARRACLRLPGPEGRGGAAPAWPRRIGYTGLAVLAAGAFSLALPARFSGITPPPNVRDGLVFVGLNQAWNMFSPNPSRTDWWVMAPGQLSDGSEYDVLPRSWRTIYSRWMKIMDRLSIPGHSGYLQEFGRSICRLHNNHLGAGQPQLMTFQIHFVSRIIPPPELGDFELSDVLLWHHRCFE